MVLLIFAGLLPGKRKTMLSAKADPPHRQDRTFFASLTIRCQVLKNPMRREKCHLFFSIVLQLHVLSSLPLLRRPPFTRWRNMCPFVSICSSEYPSIFSVPFVSFVVNSCFCHSCPFVSIRGSYSLPCLLFRAFRVFRG